MRTECGQSEASEISDREKSPQKSKIRLVGMPVCSACVNAGFNVHNLGVALGRFSTALSNVAHGGGCVSLPFDICHTALTLTLANPNPSQSVNDPGAIVRHLSACERLVIVWRWCCSTHPGSGSCHCVGGVVERH